jgi:hypothetical protein
MNDLDSRQEIHLILDEDLEDEIECEVPHSPPYCTVEVTHTVSDSHGTSALVCKQHAAATELRMEMGYACSICFDPCDECWEVRPV